MLPSQYPTFFTYKTVGTYGEGKLYISLKHDHKLQQLPKAKDWLLTP